MIKEILKWFFPKRDPLFHIQPSDIIPPEIRAIGKLYPITFTLSDNKATGEIRKIVSVRKNILNVGQALLITDKFGVTSTWIHLGNDYFKLVMKA